MTGELKPQTRALLASGVVYLAATLAMGREVLGSLGSRIASDAGDPLLTTAILAWSSRTVPWTDAWFNFPAFHPVADVLTFSEHLLGVSVVFTPIFRVTGNAIAAYNLTFLATYVLCGLAMYALVWRLTRNAAASFLAGLAYAFAPYRVAHIPHIQVLAAFWAPLALLGLHAYLDTRKRRWLVLFGACWSLQAAANGYLLVFFSLLVGLWVCWFVVAQRRWRDLVPIAVAGGLALLPLAPILARYVAAHERHRLTRTAAEISTFSADVASVLCAPERLAAWGWINIGDPACLAERQLFPGLALVAICLAGLAFGRRGPSETSDVVRRRASVASLVFTAAGLVMVAAAVSVAVSGPSTWSAGPFAMSARSVAKPFTRGLVLLLVALLCSPRTWTAVRTASVPWFYGIAAALIWVCSWGPTPTLGGHAALASGPYAWLMLLPGLDGLRVPARFWAMSVLCLSVLVGLVAARVSVRRPGRVAGALATAVAAAALLADGWSTIPSAQALPAPPRPDLLARGVVLTLPLGTHHEPEIAAEFDAVLGGWHSVNGYSGYEPGHYSVLKYAAARTDPAFLAPFLARGDLNVVVYESAPQFIEMMARVPGAVERARGNGVRQYWIPRHEPRPVPVSPGARRTIGSLSVSCVPATASRVLDGNADTRWECGPQRPGQTMTADLGSTQTVGAVVPSLGSFPTDFPRELQVDTSTDGRTWEPAWKAGVLPEVVEGMLRDPAGNRLVVAFPPRPARFVRLQLTSRDDFWYWSIAELEIWSGGGP